MQYNKTCLYFWTTLNFGFELVNQNMFEMKILKTDPHHISCHLPFENDSLSKCEFITYLWSSHLKTSICDMIIIKLFTWLTNLFQSYEITCLINIKNHFNYFLNIFAFFSTL